MTGTGGAGGGFVRLDARVVRLWRQQGGIALASVTLACVAGVVITVIAGGPAPIAGAVAVVVLAPAMGLWWYLPPYRYEHASYRLGPSAVELRHGAVFRQESVIPYFRVQHVDSSSGPLERRLGLARLEVHTASAATDAKVVGLAAEDAVVVRHTLMERAGADDGV